MNRIEPGPHRVVGTDGREIHVDFPASLSDADELLAILDESGTDLEHALAVRIENGSPVVERMRIVDGQPEFDVQSGELAVDTVRLPGRGVAISTVS